MKEKIALLVPGFLLLAASALCFWINLYLGFFVLVFSAGVLWLMCGVKKKKVDRAMSQVAEKTGLVFQKSFLKYGTLTGNYKGYDTEVGVYSDTGAFGGLGVLFASLSGEGILATMEIRNFTGIRMRHNLALDGEKIISEEGPCIVVDKEWAYLILPHVSEDKQELKNNLDRLYRVIKNLLKA